MTTPTGITARAYGALFIVLLVLTFAGITGFLIWQLSEKSAEVATQESARKVVQANYDGLEKELARIKGELGDLEKRNETLRRDVKESEKKISKISSQRDKALVELRRKPIPEGCEQQFEWLRDRAMEQKR